MEHSQIGLIERILAGKRYIPRTCPAPRTKITGERHLSRRHWILKDRGKAHRMRTAHIVQFKLMNNESERFLITLRGEVENRILQNKALHRGLTTVPLTCTQFCA